MFLENKKHSLETNELQGAPGRGHRACVGEELWGNSDVTAGFCQSQHARTQHRQDVLPCCPKARLS